MLSASRIASSWQVWHHEGMALPHLVRTSEVGRLLGVTGETIIKWARRLGLELARCPVRGMPTASPAGTVKRNCPMYMTHAEATKLLDAMLPGLVNKVELRRARLDLVRRASASRQGAALVTHELVPDRVGVPEGTSHP